MFIAAGEKYHSRDGRAPSLEAISADKRVHMEEGSYNGAEFDLFVPPQTSIKSCSPTCKITILEITVIEYEPSTDTVTGSICPKSWNIPHEVKTTTNGDFWFDWGQYNSLTISELCAMARITATPDYSK
ncbi:hypothetical protein TNIN_2261 [Trichonephila inaurata madagascariensis]|uniref:Uncharacterized protein n=1 Tax=Trichonephila inaurata madagascariensis TaxID=2747483 RepID=A0A8X6WP22_9ARAC|nr:hypothetical protein TNIN_2261 [Trichonephila inaurata madagascariensis]